jgi:hypothetical protein
MVDYQPRPRVRFAEVREKKAANGRTYYSFYMGKVRATMFRDDRTVPPEGVEALWNIYVEEVAQAAPRPKPQQAAPEQRNSASGQSRPAAGPSRTAARTAQDARAEASLRERNIDPNSQVSEDDLPF